MGMIRHLQNHDADFIGIQNFKLIPNGTVVPVTTSYDLTAGNTIDSNSDKIFNATIFKFIRIQLNVTAVTGTWTPQLFTEQRRKETGFTDQLIKAGAGITATGQYVLTVNLYMENFVFFDRLLFYLMETVAGSITVGADAMLYT